MHRDVVREGSIGRQGACDVCDVHLCVVCLCVRGSGQDCMANGCAIGPVFCGLTYVFVCVGDGSGLGEGMLSEDKTCIIREVFLIFLFVSVSSGFAASIISFSPNTPSLTSTPSAGRKNLSLELHDCARRDYARRFLPLLRRGDGHGRCVFAVASQCDGFVGRARCRPRRVRHPAVAAELVLLLVQRRAECVFVSLRDRHARARVCVWSEMRGQ